MSGRWALLVLLGLVAGCANKSGRSIGTGATTTAIDVNRNTERARAENARGVELIGHGKYKEAEAALREAVAADVMFGPAHNNLGKVHYHQNQLYQAAWEFEYAIKLMPNQPEPRNNLGLVFETAGRLDDAVKHYDEAMKLEPDNVQFIGNNARARLRRGDRDAEVRELLSRLVMRDTRAEWSEWAKDRLNLLPKDRK